MSGVPSTHIALIAPARLVETWPAVAPLVGLACARSSGKFLPQDIARAVAQERFQLWIVTDQDAAAAIDPARVRALVVTRLARYPRLLACELLACVGDDRADWLDLLVPIERWAVGQGCALMQPIARPGWERVLQGHGYRKTHVMLEKEIA